MSLAKITTILDDTLDISLDMHLAKFICDKLNNFITFAIHDDLLNKIVYEFSMCDLEEPPKNKLRKVIFNDTCGLEVSEKLSIVGSIIGRSKAVAADDIYDAMLALNEAKQNITAKKLASYFNWIEFTRFWIKPWGIIFVNLLNLTQL